MTETQSPIVNTALAMLDQFIDAAKDRGADWLQPSVFPNAGDEYGKSLKKEDDRSDAIAAFNALEASYSDQQRALSAELEAMKANPTIYSEQDINNALQALTATYTPEQQTLSDECIALAMSAMEIYDREAKILMNLAEEDIALSIPVPPGSRACETDAALLLLNRAVRIIAEKSNHELEGIPFTFALDKSAEPPCCNLTCGEEVCDLRTLRDFVRNEIPAMLGDNSQWKKMPPGKNGPQYILESPHECQVTTPSKLSLQMVQLLGADNSDECKKYIKFDGEEYMTASEYSAERSLRSKARREGRPRPASESGKEGTEAVLLSGDTARQILKALGVDIHRIKDMPTLGRA